jgi:hypothetical protein
MGHFKTPEGGKRLSIFCWLLADRSSLIFKPLKEGEMLVYFVWGVFLVTCRSEWGHFRTPEGGKLLSNFLLAACRPQFLIF